jgi:hypothetical protein
VLFINIQHLARIAAANIGDPTKSSLARNALVWPPTVSAALAPRLLGHGDD